MKLGERRKAEILDAGLQLWRQTRTAPTARAIAKSLGMTHTTVLYHFKSGEGLGQALATYAVQSRDPVTVPMLIVARNAATAILSEDEKAAFLRTV